MVSIQVPEKPFSCRTRASLTSEIIPVLCENISLGLCLCLLEVEANGMN